MGVGDTFHFYAYISDDGELYSVKMSAAVAAEGGFTQLDDPKSEPGWPYGPKNMRHVWGVSDTGKRTRLPLALNNNSKYVSGGTFSLHGTSYQIQGAIGEHRELSAMGG